MDLNRCDQVPQPGPKFWIERLEAGKEGQYTLFAMSIWGINVHWDAVGRRSLPCTLPRTSCMGCRSQLAARWKGYVHAFDHFGRRQCFLEFTPFAAKQLESLLGKGANLRGQRITLKRGKGDKSRLKVGILTPLATGQEMPAAMEPEKTLLELWRLGGWQPQLDYDRSSTPPPDDNAGF